MKKPLARSGHLERRLLAAELRHFAISARALHVAPLLGAGILAVSWQFPPPPLLAAVVTGFAALEPQFNSILFRTPREFQAMSLLPVAQKRLVIVKNIATVILAVCMAALSASVLLFFSRASVGISDAGNASLLFLSLVFPLLHSGNRRSLQYPRRVTGWQTDDVIEGLGFLITMAVLSLPYLLLVTAMNQPVLCLLYSALVAVYWLRTSVPSTAQRIDQQRIELCSSP